jgi:hypothetical protein
LASSLTGPNHHPAEHGELSSTRGFCVSQTEGKRVVWLVSAVQQGEQLLELGALPACDAALVVLLLIIVVGEESVMYL